MAEKKNYFIFLYQHTDSSRFSNIVLRFEGIVGSALVWQMGSIRHHQGTCELSPAIEYLENMNEIINITRQR